MMIRACFFLVELVGLALLTIRPATAQSASLPDSLTLPEFHVLIQEMSEPGQEFHTDNLTSNEIGYLHPIPLLRKVNLSDGVYVGVGPEQNFTYIGAIQPRMAFIVDIRRQNMLQHLMYKALFTMSNNRAEFLSKLFCKPLPEDLSFIDRMFIRLPEWAQIGRSPSIVELIEYFDRIEPVESLYTKNLEEVISLVRTFGIDSPEDLETVESVYRAFYLRQFDIQYDLLRQDSKQRKEYPDLRDLLKATTLQGEYAGFLADDKTYRFVKELQRRNLIVPIVGDFSGAHALRAIADYITEQNAVVSVFYVSNVESYLLLGSGHYVYSKFMDNVISLPTDTSSVYIRTFSNDFHPEMRSHPDRFGDHGFTTLVQPISYLFDDGTWITRRGFNLYRHIVTTGNL